MEDILFNKDFYIPDKKYYPTNAEYHRIDYLFCLYYNVYYHFKEQVIDKKKLVNKEKLFNCCHLNLYNIMDRIFEVTKWHFRIFKSVSKYNFTIQIYFIFTITILYNFICKHQSQKYMYKREKLFAKKEDAKRNNKDDIETRVILAKKDRKKLKKY